MGPTVAVAAGRPPRDRFTNLAMTRRRAEDESREHPLSVRLPEVSPCSEPVCRSPPPSSPSRPAGPRARRPRPRRRAPHRPRGERPAVGDRRVGPRQPAPALLLRPLPVRRRGRPRRRGTLRARRRGRRTSASASPAPSPASSHGGRRVVTGLPSLAAPDGGGAHRPADVVVLRPPPATLRGHHRARRTSRRCGTRSARRPAARAPWSPATCTAGRRACAADLAAYEAEADPDGNGPDSNPTGMIATGWSAVVTDSGGNTLLRVLPGGRIKTLAVFPDTIVPDPSVRGPGTMPMQAVPTSVVRGRRRRLLRQPADRLPLPARAGRASGASSPGRSPPSTPPG